MTGFAITSLKVAGCYLVAGAAYLLYFKWPNYEGHAHVPFSSFPEFLLWSPVVPFLVFQEFLEDPANGVFGLLVYCIALTATLWAAFRWGKLKSRDR